MLCKKKKAIEYITPYKKYIDEIQFLNKTRNRILQPSKGLIMGEIFKKYKNETDFHGRHARGKEQYLATHF